MSDNRDEQLDNLLRSRRIESASPDLAQRILLNIKQLNQISAQPVARIVESNEIPPRAPAAQQTPRLVPAPTK
jgi:hypothetical protein